MELTKGKRYVIEIDGVGLKEVQIVEITNESPVLVKIAHLNGATEWFYEWDITALVKLSIG